MIDGKGKVAEIVSQLVKAVNNLTVQMELGKVEGNSQNIRNNAEKEEQDILQSIADDVEAVCDELNAILEV